MSCIILHSILLMMIEKRIISLFIFKCFYTIIGETEETELVPVHHEEPV